MQQGKRKRREPKRKRGRQGNRRVEGRTIGGPKFPSFIGRELHVGPTLRVTFPATGKGLC
ncbi:hypothetical protein MANES_16G128450v8 [Manihot esculenta]|uniref:Uncharacterized protein n=1 Tax=Manihot esculenta TaxID=3983 RepID=A0ACB7G863_MANES|nr:hypothetical protein MANES_16G128450v8 [Manihot esculenta]